MGTDLPDNLYSLDLQHSYAEQLPGFYSSNEPEVCSNPEIIYFNEPLAEQLNIRLDRASLTKLLSGNQLPDTAQPIAQAYAGHQFGQFNPQLGDGRALILGELIDADGYRHDLCLKGSGRTQFSRGGDGKAALGPMLREVLIAEAMNALTIPTTRSLAVVTTGDYVFRDGPLAGAILARTASSHIRIGTFQFFAARGMDKEVKQLADYSIERHYPELQAIDTPAEKYLALLKKVCERQAKTIAQWMSIGFIHGVMNTDNMLISGETIDYGPCAYMDAYDPNAVFSSIDHGGRYAYKNQPAIAQWNLARFAECLIPLTGEDTKIAVEQAKEILGYFEKAYQKELLNHYSKKLGLCNSNKSAPDLIQSWLSMLETQQIDFTNAFRGLASAAEGNPTKLDKLFDDFEELDHWLQRWRSALHNENKTELDIAEQLKQTNPWIIPRNHLVEAALEEAQEEKDFEKFELLLSMLENPFEAQIGFDAFTEPASASFNQSFKTFCGT